MRPISVKGGSSPQPSWLLYLHVDHGAVLPARRAEKFQMTRAGMMKHVGVLEQAGLVATEKVGRVRSCKLGARRLEAETAWLEGYRQLCDSRFDELEKVVEERR